MVLTYYDIDDALGEATMEYTVEESILHVCIYKRMDNSSINVQIDGEVIEEIPVESCGLILSVQKVEGSPQDNYYTTSFEYLNTYYSIVANMDKEEFQKILENILIKNE